MIKRGSVLRHGGTHQEPSTPEAEFETSLHYVTSTKTVSQTTTSMLGVERLPSVCEAKFNPSPIKTRKVAARI